MADTLEIGDVIVVSEDIWNDLDQVNSDINTAKGAYWEASKIMQRAKDSLWAIIHKKYPMVIPLVCSYNHDTHKLIVTGEYHRDVE